MRKVSVLALLGHGLVGCTDIRDYEGAWSGPRVGDSPALRVGVAGDAQASLRIESVDKHGMTGRLTIDGLVDDAPITSVEGAEADVCQLNPNLTYYHPLKAGLTDLIPSAVRTSLERPAVFRLLHTKHLASSVR